MNLIDKYIVLLLLFFTVSGYSQISLNTDIKSIGPSLDRNSHVETLADLDNLLVSTGQISYVENLDRFYYLSESGWIPLLNSISSSITDSLKVYVPGHGFTQDSLNTYEGNVIAVKADFSKANASSVDSVQQAYILGVVHADTLWVSYGGAEVIRPGHNLDPSDVYFLRDHPLSGRSDTLQGAVPSRTFIIVNDSTLFLSEIGAFSSNIIPVKYVPSPYINGVANILGITSDPRTPNEDVMQYIAELWDSVGVIIPGSFLVTAFPGSTNNSTYQNLDGDDQSNPATVWYWNGDFIINIKDLKGVATDVQATTYGANGTLNPLVPAGSVPTVAEVSSWYEDNYLNREFRLPNTAKAYWIGSGDHHNPDYIWELNDIPGSSELDKWDRIWINTKSPNIDNQTLSKPTTDSISIEGGNTILDRSLMESLPSGSVTINSSDSLFLVNGTNTSAILAAKTQYSSSADEIETTIASNGVQGSFQDDQFSLINGFAGPILQMTDGAEIVHLRPDLLNMPDLTLATMGNYVFETDQTPTDNHVLKYDAVSGEIRLEAESVAEADLETILGVGTSGDPFTVDTTLIATTQAVIDSIAASGGVTGPGSSTDNAIARWNGTSGDTLQNSNITIADAGQIIAPLGAQSSPTYSFSGYEDTGMYGGVNAIQFSTNGVKRAVIADAGLGIGPSVPGAEFHVDASKADVWIIGGTNDALYANLVFGEGTSSGEYGGIVRYSNATLDASKGPGVTSFYSRGGPLQLNTSTLQFKPAASSVYIETTGSTSPGDVGILNSAPSYPLDVTGIISSSDYVRADRFLATSYGNTGTPSHGWESDPNTGIFRNGADEIGFSTGGLPAVKITSNQSMVIGTSSIFSDYKLKVDGNTWVTGEGVFLSSADDNTRVLIGEADGTFSTYGGINWQSSSQTLNIGTSHVNDFLTLRLDEDGEVGIGAIPTESLDVNGGVRLREDLKDINNSSGTAGQVLSSLGDGLGTDWVDETTITDDPGVAYVSSTGVDSTASIGSIYKKYKQPEAVTADWNGLEDLEVRLAKDTIIFDTWDGVATLSPPNGKQIVYSGNANFVVTDNGTTQTGFISDAEVTGSPTSSPGPSHLIFDLPNSEVKLTNQGTGVLSVSRPIVNVNENSSIKLRLRKYYYPDNLIRRIFAVLLGGKKADVRIDTMIVHGQTAVQFGDATDAVGLVDTTIGRDLYFQTDYAQADYMQPTNPYAYYRTQLSPDNGLDSLSRYVMNIKEQVMNANAIDAVSLTNIWYNASATTRMSNNYYEYTFGSIDVDNALDRTIFNTETTTFSRYYDCEFRFHVGKVRNCTSDLYWARTATSVDYHTRSKFYITGDDHLYGLDTSDGGKSGQIDLSGKTWDDCEMYIDIKKHVAELPVLDGEAATTITNSTIQISGSYHNTATGGVVIQLDDLPTSNTIIFKDLEVLNDSTVAAVQSSIARTVYVRGSFNMNGIQKDSNITYVYQGSDILETQLTQDSILTYTRDGIEEGRDTIRLDANTNSANTNLANTNLTQTADNRTYNFNNLNTSFTNIGSWYMGSDNAAFNNYTSMDIDGFVNNYTDGTHLAYFKVNNETDGHGAMQMVMKNTATSEASTLWLDNDTTATKQGLRLHVEEDATTSNDKNLYFGDHYGKEGLWITEGSQQNNISTHTTQFAVDFTNDEIILGTTTLDANQTLGAAQTGFALVYDNATTESSYKNINGVRSDVASTPTTLTLANSNVFYVFSNAVATTQSHTIPTPTIEGTTVTFWTDATVSTTINRTGADVFIETPGASASTSIVITGAGVQTYQYFSGTWFKLN